MTGPRAEEPTILGTYSTEEERTIGHGGTRQGEMSRIFWFAVLIGEVVQVQPLNQAGLPSGVKKNLKAADFQNRFRPEPGMFTRRILPVLLGLLGKYDPLKGPDLALLTPEEKGAYKALRPSELTQKTVTGTPEQLVHQMLSRLSAAQDKLIFSQGSDLNITGIDARRRGDLDSALESYLQALEVLPRDENLLFNIARAYHERGDVRECLDALNRALELAPDFEPAVRFKRYVAARLR